MKGNAWLIFLATATLELGVIVVACWVMWIDFTADERALLARLWIGHAGIPILTGLFLLFLLGLGINLMFRWYVTPLRNMAEKTRVIAISNPKHRLTSASRPELQELTTSINLLAERYQALQEDVQNHIREANAALEEEKNTLAALMSKLTQGVLVCNRVGRILLYNHRAQALLGGPARRSGAGDWIGLGRSLYGILDEHLIHHALRHIEHRLRQGETGLMTPFVASRPGGQLLNIHLVPILDKENNLTGYLLTLEDITRRTATESRRGVLMQSLTEGQRSSIANIRAAIETILEYPHMDANNRHQFQMVIRDEAHKLSRHLDQLETKYSNDLKMQWPLEEMLGSDLLAAIERGLRDTLNINVKISVPVAPLWVKVDSYAVVQSLLFVIGQLQDCYDAKNLQLTMESHGPFACMTILWTGASLDMETLRAWGKQIIIADKQNSALTLHDVIERHGSAVWSHTESASGQRCIRHLLPLIEGDVLMTEPTAEEIQRDMELQGHDYDFHLFKHSAKLAELEDATLGELSYTVIDTETTGLNPSEGDEIIALGAVRIVNGRILRRENFDYLINPCRTISEAAVAIHGISPEMVRGMPTIDQVLPRFYRFVEDTVIVGHNVAFDMRFLTLKEAQTGVKFTHPVLDTLLLAYLVHPNQEAQSLEAIAQRFGIVATGRHTALGDALTTAEIFLALIPLLEERGIRTLSQARLACAQSEYAKIRY
jgi:DNA polymerase-3 subunit epsilon